MGRDRVGEEAKLADVRGGGDIESLGVVVERRLGGGNGRRQATVERGVQ